MSIQHARVLAVVEQCLEGSLPSAAIFAQLVPAEAHAVFCDALARHLADEFLEGRMSYQDADRVVNMMWAASYVDHGVRELGVLSHDVYGAFDAGEFRHDDDSDAVDPVEQYTRPLLLRALA